jgi:hypothetical protein
MITPTHLYRAGAGAAVVGGAARVFSSFSFIGDPMTLEWLYIAIDVMLTFGLIGIYLDRAPRLGFLGVASFAVAIAALNFIGGPDADTLGFSTYQQGAAALAIATVGLSIAWVREGERPWTAPLCWFGSVVAAGALGMVPAFQDGGVPMLVAGALFGAGFVSAGVDLYRRNV